MTMRPVVVGAALIAVAACTSKSGSGGGSGGGTGGGDAVIHYACDKVTALDPGFGARMADAFALGFGDVTTETPVTEDGCFRVQLTSVGGALSALKVVRY